MPCSERTACGVIPISLEASWSKRVIAIRVRYHPEAPE
jgi:hypothetical protein